MTSDEVKQELWRKFKAASITDLFMACGIFGLLFLAMLVILAVIVITLN